MQLKLLARYLARGRRDEAAPPLYQSVLGFSSMAAFDLLLSSQLLWYVVQPARAPFAFGGWLIGRGACWASELVDLDIEYEQ